MVRQENVANDVNNNNNDGNTIQLDRVKSYNVMNGGSRVHTMSGEHSSTANTGGTNSKESRPYKYHLMINCDNVEIEKCTSNRLFPNTWIDFFRSTLLCGPVAAKFLSALFYAISSFLIVVINKVILTNYR